jgi:hypothetical protein
MEYKLNEHEVAFLKSCEAKIAALQAAWQAYKVEEAKRDGMILGIAAKLGLSTEGVMNLEIRDSVVIFKESTES